MFAQINDTQIFFDVVGEQLNSLTSHLHEKPTVVIIHGGLGFDHGYLRTGMDPMSIEFNLIYWDMRGQGRSEGVPYDSITLEQCADDAKALCDYLGIRKAFFLGHSAGGFVAQLVALRHPEIVRGLVLCDTSSGKKFTEEERIQQKMPMLKDRAPPEILAIAASLFTPATLEEITDKGRVAKHREFLRKVGPFYLAPGHEDMFGPTMQYTKPTTRVMDHFVANILPFYDISDRIHNIIAPTLVISGAFDWVCSPLAGKFIASQIQHSVFVLFENSGHMPFIEEPERFDDLVVNFIMEASL